MSEFDKLRAELNMVPSLTALAAVANISRRHLERIRGGYVDNITLSTLDRIRAAMEVQAKAETKRKRKAAA